MMKFSFDLDGTAWKYRRFFSTLAHILKASGHSVGVLTSHNEALKEADLHLWRARGFPEPDFFYNAKDMEGIGGDLRDRKIALASTMRIDCHIDDFDSYDRIEMVMLNQQDESKL